MKEAILATILGHYLMMQDHHRKFVPMYGVYSIVIPPNNDTKISDL